MSWLRGYKKPEEDPRETRRKKLEAEQIERQARAKQRLERQKQLQATIQARQEADKALQELLDLDPEIFSGPDLLEELSKNTIDQLLEDAEDIPAAMADFATENGDDGDDAMRAMLSVKCEFDKEDIAFWFTELESQLEVIEVKSQWTKRVALQRFLPVEIKHKIKALLKEEKATAGTDIYKRIKAKLLNLYGTKPEDAYKKAKNRVMTGKPSELGEELVDDICDCVPRLNCKCCARQVWGMFREALPVVIRNHIAQLEFNKDTYLQIFKICDQVYDSNRSEDPRSVAAVSVTNTTPEVAATSFNKQGRGRGS